MDEQLQIELSIAANAIARAQALNNASEPGTPVVPPPPPPASDGGALVSFDGQALRFREDLGVHRAVAYPGRLGSEPHQVLTRSASGAFTIPGTHAHGTVQTHMDGFIADWRLIGSAGAILHALYTCNSSTMPRWAPSGMRRYKSPVRGWQKWLL